MPDTIRLSEPDIGPDEIRAVVEVLKSGQLTQGDQTPRFENAFANFVGTDGAVAVSSATTGLELALWSLGVGVGDEVIVPDFSWPATGNAVIARGATPVFADIQLDTFCINVEHARTLISGRTKAIMPVHAFGHMADMSKINEMASTHGISVIEDAACAFGSYQNKMHAGLFGDLGVFSFHPRKIITTGEGGMVVARSAKTLERAKLGRTHGAIRTGPFAEFIDFGFNFRMTEFQAALGTIQVTRGEKMLADRRANADYLSGCLASSDLLTLPSERAGFVHSFQSYVVLLDESLDRSLILDFLQARGIESTLGTYSMSSQPSFQKIIGSPLGLGLEKSRLAFRKAISLPMHSRLTLTQIEYVADSLIKAMRSQKKS